MHRILKKDLGIVNLDTQWEVRRVAELHSPTTNGGRLVSIEMPKHIGEIVGSDLAIVIGESNQSAACILHPSVASSPQTGTALFHKPNGEWRRPQPGRNKIVRVVRRTIVDDYQLVLRRGTLQFCLRNRRKTSVQRVYAVAGTNNYRNICHVMLIDLQHSACEPFARLRTLGLYSSGLCALRLSCQAHSKNAATRTRDVSPELRTSLSSDAIPSRITGPSYIDFAFLRAASPRRAHRPSSLSSRTQASAIPISSSRIRISFSSANDSPSAPTVVDTIAFP